MRRGLPWRWGVRGASVTYQSAAVWLGQGSGTGNTLAAEPQKLSCQAKTNLCSELEISSSWFRLLPRLQQKLPCRRARSWGQQGSCPSALLHHHLPRQPAAVQTLQIPACSGTQSRHTFGDSECHFGASAAESFPPYLPKAASSLLQLARPGRLTNFLGSKAKTHPEVCRSAGP